MATTLQRLLDDLTARTGAPTPTARIEDTTGALGHLGRALAGLAQDGLTATASVRQRTATELAAACATAGRLWPHTGGPLTDLAGAAADLVGRGRDTMGRAHRWAVTVELAAAAEHCARLGHRLLPPAAAPELGDVRQLASAVEGEAQVDQPTPAGSLVLDRPVPLPGPGTGDLRPTALDALATLLATLDRAQRADDLTLREFRAAVAAAELTSRCAATAVGRTGEDAGPLLIAGLAWQLVGRSSTVFHDLRRGEAGDRTGVIAASQVLVRVLSDELAAPTDTGELPDRAAPVTMPVAIEQVVSHLPALADVLAMAVDRWSRTGRLYANARDLPPMEDMPGDRVQAVISGRQVQAHGADLDRLRLVVARAVDLSTGLADMPTLAASRTTVPVQAPVDRGVRGERVPGSPQCLLDRAQTAAWTSSASRYSSCAPWGDGRRGPQRDV